eukprot:scaffold51827_cov60-Cyclotella_meneghiniana.AAC.2
MAIAVMNRWWYESPSASTCHIGEIEEPRATTGQRYQRLSVSSAFRVARACVCETQKENSKFDRNMAAKGRA